MRKKAVIKWTVLTAAVIAAGTGVSIYGFHNLKAGSVQASEGRSGTPEEEVLTEVLEQQRTSHSSEGGKEETVYVITDASGNVDEIIVSNWLKNAEGAETLEDATTLENIENVKGEGTYTAGIDDEIVWEANGSDVYYQGTTDQELPVEIALTYYLNGQEISPEELAGKSGHVTIRFDYTNHVTRTVSIGGEDTEMYVPFAVLSGLILPLDQFSNISVTNGKIISEGNNDIIVGLAFPGLSENLNLDRSNMEERLSDSGIELNIQDAEIPDYVEVSADVTDFSLEMTLSMILADPLSNVDFSSEIDLSTVSEQLAQLNDSADALSDSSAKLVEGSGELAAGTDAMADGLETLAAGSGSILSGVQQLGDSLSDMLIQLEPAHEKYEAATQGIAQAQAGGLPEDYAYCVVMLGMDPQSVMTLDPKVVSGYAASAKQTYLLLAQIDAMYQAVASKTGDIAMLVEGTAQLDAGIRQAEEGAASLQEGADALYGGMAAFDEEGIQVLAEAISGIDLDGALEFAERSQAIMEISGDYTTYSGALEDTDSSVKFIVRTGAIR